jgi:hypothetical protein
MDPSLEIAIRAVPRSGARSFVLRSQERQEPSFVNRPPFSEREERHQKHKIKRECETEER